MDQFSDPAYHVATKMLVPTEMGGENARKQVGIPPLCSHCLYLVSLKQTQTLHFKPREVQRSSNSSLGSL